MAGITNVARRARRLLICTVAALLAVTIAPSAALAANRLSYSEQARAAGLTAAQAMELQAKVDGYLAKTGGVQTAANRIEYATGAILLVTLPTEKRARDLSAAPASAADLFCYYYWLCLYEDADFTGDYLKLYYCGVWQGVPWHSQGSWINNQTEGTSWAIRDEYGRVAFWYPATSWMESGQNWSPIVQAKAC
jgi:hypothetical protein